MNRDQRAQALDSNFTSDKTSLMVSFASNKMSLLVDNDLDFHLFGNGLYNETRDEIHPGNPDFPIFKRIWG